MEWILLNDGNKVPSICFGPGIMSRGLRQSNDLLGKITYRYKLNRLKSRYSNAIISALDNGVRFIDYSASYGNEPIVAKAIQKCAINRESIKLTTRVPNSSQYKCTVRETALRSIERFNTDYVDLLMFHWPVTGCFVQTWEELIKLREDGYCKSIGVANCHVHHIEQLVAATGVLPAINQVEVHPLFSQKSLLSYCQEKGIVVEAYTPLARMDERMVRLPILRDMSNRYCKSISQLVLRWHIQNGVIPVFRSLNNKRQKENLSVFDFKLSKDDMDIIDSININSRLRYDPDNCDFTIL